MKKFLLLTIAAMLILAGCGKKETPDKESAPTPPEPIAVDLKISPEKVDVGTPVTFEAVVTQGTDKVDDANEVKFEIWKKGMDDHEMIDGEHKGDGIYAIQKSFDQDGIYYVVSHVTARSMHNMPKKEFVVGNGEAATSNGADQTEAETGHDHESGHHDDESGEHHAHGDLMIHLMTADEIKANQETTLTAHITSDDKALTEAEVQFEIWKDNDEKHYYVKATEEAGKYQAQTTFSEAGKYSVKVHVLKGEIHDHQVEIVEVK